MLKEFCVNVTQNKNTVMFISVGVYILALYSVLSGFSQVFALAFTLFAVVLILKNLFPLKYIIIWVLIFYLGILNTSLRLKDTDSLLNLSPVNSTIYGQVISIPQNKNDTQTKFFFKVNKIEYDGLSKDFVDEKTIVTLNSIDKLKIYDNYQIKGRLAIPFKAGNPSQFDYGSYLRNFDTYSVFYGKEYVKIDGNLTSLQKALQWINDYREKIITVHSRYLASPNLEILGGIVFGDDAVSPPENIKQSFINSGLLHILAASGMNVAFIFSFFFFFLSLLKVNYKVNILVCMLTVGVYSLMTGLGASVIRATFMLLFVLVGKLIDRDAHSVSLLSFVAFLMLLYNPMFINDVGFQLSFVVTLGLLVMTPHLVQSKNKYVNWIIGTISVPIIAQLWVIPIQIFYFNNISLYSVFANIMSVPLLSVISFGGFVSSVLSVITPIANLVCKCFDFVLNPLISILVNISDFWGKLPHSTFQTTHPSVSQILVYYLILIIITALFDSEVREKFGKYLKILVLILLSILILSTIPIQNKNLEITAFDVGNADSFLIKTPNNRYIMIDTARNGYKGGKSQAEIIILKYLKDIGIKEIDTLIITHFDSDHCGGAVDMLEGIKINHVYVNSLNHPSVAAKEIYAKAGQKLHLAENKQHAFVEGDLKLTNFVAHSEAKEKNEDNETSILTLLEYGEFKMLFTGDSGIVAYNKLKRYLPEVTVLKVGHHGALGVLNKEMLEGLRPKAALVSVGENKFGHPSIYTLALLKDVKVYRTDVCNSIRIVVNSKGYDIKTYDTHKKVYK